MENLVIDLKKLDFLSAEKISERFRFENKIKSPEKVFQLFDDFESMLLQKLNPNNLDFILNVEGVNKSIIQRF